LNANRDKISLYKDLQDHRNHGTRLRDPIANLDFKKNANHVSVVSAVYARNK
jgi:hypothetical protein